MDNCWTMQRSSPESGIPYYKSPADESASAGGSKSQAPKEKSASKRTSPFHKPSSANPSRGGSPPTKVKDTELDHVTACIPDSTQSPMTLTHHPHDHHHHHHPSTNRSRMHNCNHCPDEASSAKDPEAEERELQHRMDFHRRLILLPPSVYNPSLYSESVGRPIGLDGRALSSVERGLMAVGPMMHLRDFFTNPCSSLSPLTGDAQHNHRLHSPHQLIRSQQQQQILESISGSTPVDLSSRKPTSAASAFCSSSVGDPDSSSSPSSFSPASSSRLPSNDDEVLDLRKIRSGDGCLYLSCLTIRNSEDL